MDVDKQREERRAKVLEVMQKTYIQVPAKLLRDVGEGKITSSAYFLCCYLLFRQGGNAKYWG
jgi:hypothetical protein